ncbi:MAG: hypothetical protein F4Z66_12795 [Gammaproteobacteria bacterium]|nr:hypothetical protein [Gammaproteobacteria bacterium]
MAGLCIALAPTIIFADLTGTYVFSFGELEQESAFREAIGTRLMDELRESAAKGEMVLELRDTDDKNQIEVTLKDSTTEDVEDSSFPLHPNPIPHGATVLYFSDVWSMICPIGFFLRAKLSNTNCRVR